MGRPYPAPTEAIISVTNRCDARCSMCNIWQLPRQELLNAEDYRRGLPRGLRNVNLTGGEPLLRPDIVEISHAKGHEARSDALAATVAQNSDVYYASDGNQAIDAAEVARQFGALVRARLRSASPKDWLRAYFDHGVIHFAATGARLSGCDAASGFFFLAPTGDVYPCLTLSRVLGNIRRSSFDSLWQGEEARRIREETRRCKRCWMMCTARSELKRHPVAVARWVGRERARSLIGG